MRDFSPNLYPFVYDPRCGLPLSEVTHIWNECLPAILAAIVGDDAPAIPFEQGIELDVPLMLVYPHCKVEGFCRIHLRHLSTKSRSRYVAELRCYPKDNPDVPYLELLSRSDTPELAIMHLTYSIASYLFAIEGEIESVA